jgi:hypothetical protein
MECKVRSGLLSHADRIIRFNKKDKDQCEPKQYLLLHSGRTRPTITHYKNGTSQIASILVVENRDMRIYSRYLG